MIDMHMHTCISDGANTPEEMIEMLKKLNVREASITDHDSAGAYSLFEGKIENGKIQLGTLTLITGAEIDCQEDEFGFGFEILGYGFNPENKELKSYLAEIQSKRKKRALNYIEQINTHFKSEAICASNVLNAHESVLKPHLIHPLIDGGFIKNYKDGKNLLQGMNDTEIDRISAKGAIELIHEAGGSAFLAHPGVYDQSFDDVSELIVRLSHMGIDGIELYYPYSIAVHGRAEFLEAGADIKFSEKLKSLFPCLKYSQGSDSHSAEDICTRHSAKGKWAVIS